LDRLLVDLITMSPDRMLDLVGVAGGPLADAKLWHLEVIESEPLSPNLQRVVLTASDLNGLRYIAGQDLMLRVPQSQERVVNRRYTIRSFDAARSAVAMDVSLHGLGPGTDWIRAAKVGDRIDAIGPRGKITLRMDADWHLFVADETGMPGALAMIEALPSTSTATALL
jgi:NADPH-dependent ferric siderophore reductase